jgi:ACS family glucarate transporter-like MFS transporter/ACS family D-galactonate transporter-like MFS transporter
MHPKNTTPDIELTGRSTNVRYRALAWLTVAAILAYLCRSAVGVAESTIRDELELNLDQSGWFMGAFFWTYAVFQIPSGWFAERRGTRIALTTFAIGWSAATLGIGIAPGFWLLLLAQLSMGVAQAGLMPAACNSVGHWMPLAQRSLAIGFIAAGMQIGAIAASGLTGTLLDSLGWRTVFIAFALPGIAWALGFFAQFRDDPAQVLPPDSPELALIRSGRTSNASPSRKRGDEWPELRAIALSPNVWWLCGQQICRAAAYNFFAAWFPTFLQKSRGVSVAESGYLQGLVLGGSLVGALLGGFITDWIWRRTGNLRVSRSGVGATSLAACSMLTLSAWFVESTEVAVGLLALGAVCAAFAGPCTFAAAIDIAGPRVPQVSATINMCGNFAAAASPIVVAKIFLLTENWDFILVLFAGVFLAGAVCWLFANPQVRLSPAAD